MTMSKSYENLLRNLNVVKWELKNRNDPTLNVCIKYIKDAIVEAGRLNNELEKLEIAKSFRADTTDLDVCDCVD
jgi:hypothetical protein